MHNHVLIVKSNNFCLLSYKNISGKNANI